MVPTYRAGDALVVSPASDLRPGEIISYKEPKDPSVIVSHRLLSDDDLLVTKGDNVAKPDVAFSESLVVGQVRASLPQLGYVLDFLHKPIGIALTVYVPALVLVLGEIKRLSRYFGRSYYKLLGAR
jgi:signal peptidase I